MTIPRAKPRIGASLLLLALASVVPSSFAQGQSTLRWKLETGAETRYVIKQSFKTTLESAGQRLASKMSQTLDVAWRVDQFENDGTAFLAFPTDRGHKQSEAPN